MQVPTSTKKLGLRAGLGQRVDEYAYRCRIEPDEAGRRIKFDMGISSNYFMEIAKFRAARMLWAQIVKQYAPKCDCACKMNVHATTSGIQPNHL